MFAGGGETERTVLATVCLPAADPLGLDRDPLLYHYADYGSGEEWTDRTHGTVTTPPTGFIAPAAGFVCGETDLFSPFAVGFDAALTFGTNTIGDQIYKMGVAITDLILPVATGGTAPLNYTLTPDIAGLSFTSANRTLAGTPTGSGTQTLTYTVTDSAPSSDSAELIFSVTVVGDLVFTPPTVRPQTFPVNQPVTLTLPEATGGIGVLTYTLTATPAGLTFSDDGTTRLLAGTPTTVTTTAASLTYTVTDNASPQVSTALTFSVTVVTVVEDLVFTPPTVGPQTFPVNQPVTLPLPAATGGTGELTYALTPFPVGLTFDPATRIFSGTPTELGTQTLTYTVTDSASPPVSKTLTFTVTVVEVEVVSARLNEQILSVTTQATTAATLAAVAERVESVATGALTGQLGGQTSLHGFLETHGKAMLEQTMEYEQLLDGASFVVPLRAAGDDQNGGIATPVAVWGSKNYDTLGGDEDNLDWDGRVDSTHFGMDARLGEDILAGVALSWNRGKFDYREELAGVTTSGEYEYTSANVQPYFGWSPSGGFSLWAMAGIGEGEIEVEADDAARRSTDTTQKSLAVGVKSRLGGAKSQILNSDGLPTSSATTLSVKADVVAVQVRVDEASGGGPPLRRRMLTASGCGCCWWASIRARCRMAGC